MSELLIDGVSHRYRRDRWALRDLSLRQGPGVLGLIGPNGAGKTTLLRILATLLRPTEGLVDWDGHDLARDPRPVRRSLGYLPQDFGVYPQLTVREFLRYLGTLKELGEPLLGRRVEAVLGRVRLLGEADRRLGDLSGGMIRRVGIAQALLTEPRLLVLDEPTAGLDPAERIHFREILATRGAGCLTVLATHIIGDVAAVATDLALLDGGRLIWSGSPESLLADAAGTAWALRLPATEFEARRAGWRVSAAIRRGAWIDARVVADARPHPQATAAAPSLEEAYLYFARADRADG